nr:methyltransferase, TIGR04325 family [Methylomonas sp. SURF-1]
MLIIILVKISSSFRQWFPPILIDTVNNIFSNTITFSSQVSSWDFAVRDCVGYDAASILNNVLDSTLKVKQGIASYERDSVLFYKCEYDWSILSGLMFASARNSGRLNVLDFGGALGSSYFQHRDFLNELSEVRWNIVEQVHFVQAGRDHIQDHILRFYSSIPECLSENRPNAIFLSGVLQYLPDPFDILKSLMISDADVLIIDKTIVNDSQSDRLYIQHVPDSIYKASYPCWSLSESKLINAVSSHYSLKADFPSLSFPVLKLIKSEFKGYIFQRIVP